METTTNIQATFRMNALKFIRKIYNQRKFLEKHGGGGLILSYDEKKLFRYYEYWGCSWTAMGIAGFFIENQQNIETLIPANKAKQNRLKEFHDLIETAKIIRK